MGIERLQSVIEILSLISFTMLKKFVKIVRRIYIGYRKQIISRPTVVLSLIIFHAISHLLLSFSNLVEL